VCRQIKLRQFGNINYHANFRLSKARNCCCADTGDDIQSVAQIGRIFLEPSPRPIITHQGELRDCGLGYARATKIKPRQAGGQLRAN
jgi:hypothetical protein